MDILYIFTVFDLVLFAAWNGALMLHPPSPWSPGKSHFAKLMIVYLVLYILAIGVDTFYGNQVLH